MNNKLNTDKIYFFRNLCSLYHLWFHCLTNFWPRVSIKPSYNATFSTLLLLSTYYLLSPRRRFLLVKLAGFQLVKKFSTFYGTRRFIIAFTSARHLSLPWASSIQSISPHPTSWRSILILSSHLSLGLLSCLFPSGFPTKTLYTPIFSPIRATCPAHLIPLDFINRTIVGEEYRSLSSSLCSLHFPPLRSKYSSQNPVFRMLNNRFIFRFETKFTLTTKTIHNSCWEYYAGFYPLLLTL